MTKLNHILLKMKIWKDTKGQDLIEYALMAGFVAVAAGAIMPNVANQIRSIFQVIDNQLQSAAAQASSAAS